MSRTVSAKKICGDSGSADKASSSEFSIKATELLSGYEPSNIFNFDESGLFWKLFPDRTMANKNHSVEGAKKLKERLSILFGVSECGEKLPPLIIGKSKKPRAFKNKNVESLGVYYDHNASAWMTTSIFKSYFQKLNEKFKAAGRKIVALLDNCSSHNIENFSNVEFIFLPPNTTSLIQPLDQGIIYNFKLKYKQQFLSSIYDSDHNQMKTKLKDFNIFSAVEHIKGAWDKVAETTIINCFKRMYSYRNEVRSPIVFVEDEAKLTHSVITVDSGFDLKRISEFIRCDSNDNLIKEYTTELLSNQLETLKTTPIQNEDEKKTKLKTLKTELINLKEKFYLVDSEIATLVFNVDTSLNVKLNK